MCTRVSSNAASFFASGLKGRAKEAAHEDHVALHGTYRMVTPEGGALVERDVALRSAMNEVLRDEYVADCQRGVDKWNRAIASHGIRNALLTSIAPTGTISLFADNVSSGVEPVFAHSFTRKVTNPDGSKRDELVEDYAIRLYRTKFDAEVVLPEHFVTAQTLAPEDHVRMQAALQRYVDSAISKTGRFCYQRRGCLCHRRCRVGDCKEQ